jgi:hypothetical protein
MSEKAVYIFIQSFDNKYETYQLNLVRVEKIWFADVFKLGSPFLEIEANTILYISKCCSHQKHTESQIEGNDVNPSGKRVVSAAI